MKSFSVSPATIQVLSSHTGLGACRRTRGDQTAGGAAKEGVRAAGAGRQWIEILGGGYLGKSRGEGHTLPSSLSHLQFSYVDADGAPVSVVQLTFLKLLSATARQSFTFTCQNSAAWLDEAAGDHNRSARFLGANGEELSFNQTAAATITVPYDGCRVRKRAGTGQIGEGSL